MGQHSRFPKEDGAKMAKAVYLSAREAAEELGVSPATLYSYVSRGLIRSEAVGDEKRRRRYRAEDIERLKARRELRRDPAGAAQQALSWGMPLLESELTLIADGRLYYRGCDALKLAREMSFEQTARLLWTGEAQETSFSPPSPALQLNAGAITLGGIEAFQAALLHAEAGDPAAYDLRPKSVVQKGKGILRLFTAVLAGPNGASRPAASALQSAWAPDRPEAAGLINAALVLCADHELNTSAFTVRCAASAGASPYAAVLAGLAALKGVRHGGAARRVQALFQEVERSGQVQGVLSARLQRGEGIPGFGHPLYPQGDPRARLLLEMLAESRPAQALELAQAITAEAQELLGEQPNIDFALVCLQQALGLPEDAALLLFALGRTAGWIAHAIEQYRAGTLIRPRARYTGPPPEPASPHGDDR
jgi:citrate synthase